MAGPTGKASSSVIAQPVGTQTKPSILSRTAQGLRGVSFTSEDLKDPAKLYKVLYDITANARAAIHGLSQNPLLQGNAVTGITFTGGQTVVINHGLGRAYNGYHPINDNGNIWSGKIGALPSGVTSSQCIALTSTNAGTFDFWIF
jgi:hypothetical protein